MTREEAIEKLRQIKNKYLYESFDKDRSYKVEALDMAIEALKEDEENAKYGSELARIVAEHDAADELVKKDEEEASNGH